MNLESEESFTGIVLGIGVLEIDTLFAIEPCLDVVALATDHDGVPFCPLKEFLALGGEFCALLLVLFIWEEPSTSCFIVETGAP